MDDVRDHSENLEVRENSQGNTLTRRVLLDDEALEQVPNCRNLLEKKEYLRLLSYVAATFRQPLFYIQSIKNGFGIDQPDPQKTLHSDTFHPTMKSWFFLDDVAPEQGPFTYVPGSHRLTLGRLLWEYRQSVNGKHLEVIYARRGSFRTSPDELEAMGYGKPVALAVRRNTLVVADTHGFHCRGQATGKVSRLEIWANRRTNPFNPLPGTGARWIARLEKRLHQRWWLHADQRAAAKGEQSTWHKVANKKLLELDN
ncbi:MAG: phytanoyl-CoA dioxygenase family protein [Gammaproteobacteria bacterium]|nr:phytanoyl-CoA dioxygenase family protein [Gammaproteobacteria bacterium]